MDTGALMLTFRKSPRLKYNLDFGKALGGQYVASVVKPFVNNLIQNQMVRHPLRFRWDPGRSVGIPSCQLGSRVACWDLEWSVGM